MNSPYISPEDAQFIEEYEAQYPETTNEFKKIMLEQYLMWCKKNSNYGMSNIALGSDLSSLDDRKVSLTGIFFRCLDKINRLKQMLLLGNADKVGESVMDSFKDLSVYGIIAQIVANGKWGK